MRFFLSSLLAGVLATSAAGCISEARQQKAAGRINLGSAYLREGNLPAAIDSLEEGAKLDKRNWSGWNKLGLAYMAAGAMDKADQAFLTAIELVPDEAEVLTNYGSFLIRAGRSEEALPVLEKATQDLTYRKPAIPFTNLGYAYLELGRHAEAQAALDQAVRRAPNLCHARFLRGMLYVDTGKPDRALSDFDVVVQMCGDEATGAYYQAARVLLDSGKRNDGCSYLLTAMRGAGDSELGHQARELHKAECG